MNVRQVIWWIAALIALTSCGFTPLYGVKTRSLPIKVVAVNLETQIVGKLNYAMKQALDDAFNPTHEAQLSRYNMVVNLRKKVYSYGTLSTSVNSRNRVSLNATYTVTDMDGKKIIDGEAFASDSFEIAVSPYSTLVSDEEITILLAKTIAEEIALRMTILIDDRVS